MKQRQSEETHQGQVIPDIQNLLGNPLMLGALWDGKHSQAGQDCLSFEVSERFGLSIHENKQPQMLSLRMKCAAVPWQAVEQSRAVGERRR